MWIVDRTGGECSKTVFRHKHGRSVHCSTDRIIVHTVVHASRRPRTPAPGSGTTHASHRAPRRAPHTRATERRALGALVSAPRAGVLLLASPLVLAVGLQAPFDRGFTFPEQSCTAGVPRVTWVIAYTEHADAQSYTEDEQSRRGHYLGRGVSASVRRYTSDDGSLHITAVSVTCVRWTARV